MVRRVKSDIEQLKEDLKKSLRVTEVFERYYYPVSKVKSDSSQALCPFHTDENLGSFSLSDTKGIYKCFGCGEGGDIINLVQKSQNCDFKEAIMLLAKDFGFISQEDFDKQNLKFDENYQIKKKNMIKNKRKINYDNKSNLQDELIISKVYEVFVRLSSLTEDDYRYLSDKRGLSKDRIESTYFTMPFCTKSFMIKLISELKKEGIKESDLLGVPGFYLGDDGKTVQFASSSGIGMKMRDAKSNFTRIHIRLTKPFKNRAGKMQRYVWFSSVDKEKGCGSGSPIDVSYPSVPVNDMKAILFITEGKFKSEKINEHYNCVSLSVQGVSSWRNKIKSEIIEIQKRVPIKGVFLCYDADMSSNVQVYKQCKYMVENELDIFSKDNVFMVTWDSSLGKGIDDLIENGNKEHIKKIVFTKYIELYESFLSEYKQNNLGDLLNENGDLMSKDEIYIDYMNKVFPKI